MLFFAKKKDKQEVEPPLVQEANLQSEEDEIAAAIAVALRLYSYKTMEYEETIITIQKVIRPYSPWNSKIYNLRQMPQRCIIHKPLKK
ncbi:MAG TPA: hypothetical protein PK110_07055 [Niabella sp.]|jgi:hypothetical protein|nr:hypothetical protein [Chitinophagaceae bacterium]HRN48365.1 hypothetical protein [Niabella sp.]HRO84565.1 hypothetical protein [Niabella sp.]